MTKDTPSPHVLKRDRLKHGLCRYCGHVPHPVSRNTCDHCAILLASRIRASRQRKVDAGLCRTCGQSPYTHSGYCQSCYRTHLDRSAASRRKLRDKVFAAYGGYVCACCNEDEPSFLSIDHVNNDGEQHRAEIGQGRLYYWLRDNDFPDGFQVLCMNCQFGKKHNKGICPHQMIRKSTRSGVEVLCQS